MAQSHNTTNLFDVLQKTRKLHTAVRDGDIHDIKTLVSAGASINSREPSIETTLLHTAILYDNHDVTKLLVQLGANVDARNIGGDSVLHYAVRCERVGAVKFLASVKADVNICNFDGDTPLHYAVKQECMCINDIDVATCIVQFLISVKANVTARNKRDETPLHFAVRARNFEFVKLLMGHGAIEYAYDIDNYTPIHYAQILGEKNIADFLTNPPQSHKDVTPSLLNKVMKMLSINS